VWKLVGPLASVRRLVLFFSNVYRFLLYRGNQKKKFDRRTSKLGQGGGPKDHIDLSGEQLKKWVVNIFKYKLSEPETSVLAKGLNFAVALAVIPTEEYVLSTEKACSI